MRTIFILALCLLSATTARAQSIDVKPFEAQIAKSVKIEQLPDSVAVILIGSEGSKTGAYLTITSDRKWATPVYDGINITETQVPGEWIMFAPPGKYRVMLAETGGDLRPRYTFHDVVIPKGTKPTDPDDPPPTGDFSALTKVAKDTADALKDQKTRSALATAYKGTLTLIEGKTYSEATDTVQKARRMVLVMHMKGNDANWNNWLKAVDSELVKVVPPGDATKYAQAVAAIVKGLE